jgi:hypothetical protein
VGPRCGAKLITRNMWHGVAQDRQGPPRAKAPTVRSFHGWVIELLSRCGPFEVMSTKTRIASMATCQPKGPPRRNRGAIGEADDQGSPMLGSCLIAATMTAPRLADTSVLSADACDTHRARHQCSRFRYPSRRSFAWRPLRRSTCPSTCGHFFEYCPVGCTDKGDDMPSPLRGRSSGHGSENVPSPLCERDEPFHGEWMSLSSRTGPLSTARLVVIPANADLNRASRRLIA